MEARSVLGELERVRDATEKVPVPATARGGPPTMVTAASSSAEKLALFRTRFAGRSDVHAVRWTSTRTGKSGWAPAVRGGFYTGSETVADYLPLEDRTVERHLRGASQLGEREFHAGLYPMLEGDQCRLLVCDFDDAQWRHDAAAFVMECESAGLHVLTEVSRSGTGAHVWMFFEDLVPAATARAAGMRLLRAALARRPMMDFRSYDRFSRHKTLCLIDLVGGRAWVISSRCRCRVTAADAGQPCSSIPLPGPRTRISLRPCR